MKKRLSVAVTLGALLTVGLALPAGAAAREITVVAKEFKFVPDVIHVTKGEEVSLVFKNAGALSHNLTFDGLGGLKTKTIQTGATQTLRFTAAKTGDIQFYCSVTGHREAGMHGELITTAP